MPRRKIVRFRNCLIRTAFSKKLKRFVPSYMVEEDEASAYLSELDFENMSEADYAHTICQMFLCEPDKVYKGLSEELAQEVTEEMFGVILDCNPYLAPSNMEQLEIPEPKRKRKPKVQDPIQEAIRTYEQVKETLQQNIIGQEAAVDAVLKHMGKGLLRNGGERPICALVFAGYSGVGKTEVARQLAEGLGGPERLIRVDCGEYGESHHVARLLGAPAGYVGYDESSFLERRLDPSVIQVLLLDEFEKAHRNLWNILLAALEEGSVTTGQHVSLSLRNCIVILTTNVGTRELAGSVPGFINSRVQQVESARLRVRKELPIELTTRLDEIIVFRALNLEDQKRLLILELAKLHNRLVQLVDLKWEGDASAYVREDQKMEIRHEQVLGLSGREIRRRVEELEGLIAHRILTGELKVGDEFKVDPQALLN